MWGTREKWGHIKNFRPGIVPPTCKLLPTPLFLLIAIKHRSTYETILAVDRLTVVT